MGIILSKKTKDLINRQKFGWSKWGGARREFIKDVDNDWTCQACATRHPIEVPCYMTELFDEEFAKICSKCHRIKLQEHIVEFDLLIQKVRIIA